MCGVTGFWAGSAEADPAAVVRRMADAIRYRGPDSSGEWTEPDCGMALGHRRLSILDLSPLGHQPMVSPGGRFVVAFNGEVYNFEALREELRAGAGAEQPTFCGHSDTEVLLHAVEAWGVEGAARRFVGMFVFALWDRRERVLHLVRDRLGIKPLFYGWVGRTLVFGSELKALRAFPGFDAGVDRGALALYLRHGYVPSPFTIYTGIRKLPPGTILSLASPDDRDAQPAAFWSAEEVVARGAADPFRGTDEEAAEELDRLLREAVGLRMIADVPLGAFLSGGVDSSTVVALMQAQSSRPVKTFSIGFHEEAYDEARHAAAVSAHLGTDHTEMYVTPAEALAVIPRLPEMYDEPFGDPSQVPTFLVSQLARRHVTVSLSGDGGDELFGGYNRHVWAKKVWKTFGWIPREVRAGMSRALTGVSPEGWDRLAGALSGVLPGRFSHRTPGYKLHKLAEVLPARDAEAFYHLLVSQWRRTENVVLDGTEPYTRLTDPARRSAGMDFTESMMYLDLVTYLPDDILTKVDRASMAVSLEARVPLLDHRVVEFAWRLPLSTKVRAGQGKWLLRRVLDRYVPRELIERPKTGFGVPIDSWLRGPLREWAEELLNARRLAEEGFFAPGEVRAKWHEHLSGSRDWQYQLWNVLMFQAWLESQQSGGRILSAA
jgi:asparagine synthase (glutamine-hydrolysing)